MSFDFREDLVENLSLCSDAESIIEWAQENFGEDFNPVSEDELWELARESNCFPDFDNVYQSALANTWPNLILKRIQQNSFAEILLDRMLELAEDNDWETLQQDDSEQQLTSWGTVAVAIEFEENEGDITELHQKLHKLCKQQPNDFFEKELVSAYLNDIATEFYLNHSRIGDTPEDIDEAIADMLIEHYDYVNQFSNTLSADEQYEMAFEDAVSEPERPKMRNGG